MHVLKSVCCLVNLTLGSSLMVTCHIELLCRCRTSRFRIFLLSFFFFKGHIACPTSWVGVSQGQSHAHCFVALFLSLQSTAR